MTKDAFTPVDERSVGSIMAVRSAAFSRTDWKNGLHVATATELSTLRTLGNMEDATKKSSLPMDDAIAAAREWRACLAEHALACVRHQRLARLTG
eukprot:CAMPEP_0114281164 /NCGR_PEP_ID=MMETSP0059-20121206/2833_1 /TAXON_ID=36894 /ORGANISM="Pyramimonas parkeae, Strain CCMP726" /LENGTH=94 /DNA_ID=CAMNT_0001401629 /DNA_START=110 /DNA_END=394 /DNA_ORIENTATION=-